MKRVQNRFKRRASVGQQLKTLGVATALATAFASPAFAQERTFVLDRAQISGAPDDGFMVYRPYMGEESRFYVNAAQGLTINPLRESALGPDVDSGHIMAAQFPTYLNMGLQLAGLVGLNLHIPFTPLQVPGNEPEDDGTAVAGGGLTDRWASMNDIRFDARVKFWESNDRRTRFGAHGAFTIATGQEYGFGGDGQSTALLALSGEHDFRSFLLAGHIGPHFRPNNSISNLLYVGTELRYSFGAYLPLRDNRLRLGLEVWGSTGLVKINDENTFFNGANTTVEWLAQARIAMSKDKRTYLNVGGGTRLSNGYGSADVRLMGSIGRYWGFKDSESDSPPPRIAIVDRADHHDVDSDGDGYPDDIDACPNVKEDGKAPDKTDGCPAPADSDKDGIIDVEDKCPNEAEDFDGIKDKDGCPEDDADNDKVKDEVDKCPLEPGPPNRDAAKNGCPTMTKLTGDGMVSLLKPIEFDRGKASIKPVSFPILKEVATLLEARPNLKISVQGHTDNIGSAAYNKKLSADRAASVLKYLAGQGIDESRLSSEGFGPDKPIATNETGEGRARNRRVDFVIQEGSDKADDDEAWE